MSHQFNLVIRNGLVFDATGGDPYEADIAVAAGRIAEVGRISGRGAEEINAKGLGVTPGFVDIHTHYDGQVTWDSQLAPSTSHGVTTVVMGNCGVGFAPCRPDHHDLLVRLMEGVEDIPNPVLVEGVPWKWETFPEYLDFLAARRYDADICGYVPHAALRVYVMGERGADREPATADDLAHMARLVREAMDAGAMGFSTARTFFHRSSDGKTTPTYQAAEKEFATLALALKDCGKGSIELIADFDEPEEAFGCMRRIVARSGRPLSFSLIEGPMGPLSMHWREILQWVTATNAQGLPIKAQVLGRPLGMLLGHELTLNPFYTTESYTSLGGLGFDQRIAELRKPEMRARILGEPIDNDPKNVLGRMVRRFDDIYLLGEPPNYEPSPETSIAAQACRRGVTPEEVAYDAMLENGGRNLLYLAAANYASGSLASCLEMMRHPHAVLGLGDGGAHCGTICDGSYPTFMLTHWARDRAGERLPLPWIIKSLCRTPALTLGLQDRGLIAPGLKADINVIDLDRLALHAPEVTYDLPAGGRRLNQRADGYVATVLNGMIVRREGKPTGALPGRLVRGPQPMQLRTAREDSALAA
jgi:N-acyl-D-aspartate/D-glutamate deacylase